MANATRRTSATRSRKASTPAPVKDTEATTEGTEPEVSAPAEVETPAPVEQPAADAAEQPGEVPAETPAAPASTDAPARPAKLTDNDEFWAQFLLPGYVLTSWKRAHYALYKKAAGSAAEGKPWYTATEFGTVKYADKGAEAEQNGRDRAQWDEKSAAAQAQTAAAAEKRKADAAAKAAEAEKNKQAGDTAA